MMKEFQRSFQGLSILLIVAILVICIALGILYDNLVHRIHDSFGLPLAVLGASLTLCSTGSWILTLSST